jgi:hypothetical protein
VSRVRLPVRLTAWQVRRTRAVTRWYLETHRGRSGEPGTPEMYSNPAAVGSFAVSLEDLRRGEPGALFRALVVTAMFQRRQDVQIMRILRGISPADAEELSDQRSLLQLAEGARCPHLRSNAALLERCDLGKDPVTKRGRCGARPRTPCHLKRHTELLKRYGHFGKVPTSIALAVREGGGDLASLRRDAISGAETEAEAAARLEAALTDAWRVSRKIACMFLSAVTNPDLLPGAAWGVGVDWRRYVVIDSNVDLFLEAIDYPGPWTYDARAEFVRALAQRVDLRSMDPGLREYNPRLVQQAMYLFMSGTNRKNLPSDCSKEGAVGCSRCKGALRTVCPVRS